MRIWPAAITAALVLSGCASVPPKQFDVQNTRTEAAAFDDVWAGLVGFFASNQIAIRTIEKDSGLIVAETEVQSGAPGQFNAERQGARGRIGSFADCGIDTSAIPYGYIIRLNVLARPAGDGTQVTVNTQFRELRAVPAFVMGQQTNFQIPCNSTGELERTILDAAFKPR